MPERFGQATTSQRELAGMVAAQIQNQMVRLLVRYTGRGPTKTRTTVNTNLIAVIFQDTLTKAEMNLVAAGQAQSVTEMRLTFGALMREDAIEIVEEITGRGVLTVLTDVDPEANIAAQLFVLEPVSETGVAMVSESESEGVGDGEGEADVRGGD